MLAGIIACTPMDLVKQGAKAALGANDGVSVDAQIGDRQNDVELRAGDNNSVEAKEIKGGVNYIDEGPSFPVLLLLILGWMLPDPLRIWSGIKKIPSLFRRK